MDYTHGHYQKLLETLVGPAWQKDMGQIETAAATAAGEAAGKLMTPRSALRSPKNQHNTALEKKTANIVKAQSNSKGSLGLTDAAMTPAKAAAAGSPGSSSSASGGGTAGAKLGGIFKATVTTAVSQQHFASLLATAAHPPHNGSSQ